MKTFKQFIIESSVYDHAGPEGFDKDVAKHGFVRTKGMGYGAADYYKHPHATGGEHKNVHKTLLKHGYKEVTHNGWTGQPMPPQHHGTEYHKDEKGFSREQASVHRDSMTGHVKSVSFRRVHSSD